MLSVCRWHFTVGTVLPFSLDVCLCSACTHRTLTVLLHFDYYLNLASENSFKLPPVIFWHCLIHFCIPHTLWGKRCSKLFLYCPYPSIFTGSSVFHEWLYMIFYWLLYRISNTWIGSKCYILDLVQPVSNCVTFRETAFEL